MKLYSFICSTCGIRVDHPSSDSRPCPRSFCAGVLRRDYSSINFSKPMQPHFNHSVGAYVRNMREFKDELKRKGEEAGTDYTPIDMNSAPGVTDEGLDATRARRRDLGVDQPTKRIFHA